MLSERCFVEVTKNGKFTGSVAIPIMTGFVFYQLAFVLLRPAALARLNGSFFWLQ